MTKIQNPKRSNVSVIDYWNLRFICNLVLVIWDFIRNLLLNNLETTSDTTTLLVTSS
jgi:hypothetical protein